jgi:pentatricopeptide repeat protein
MRWKFFKHLLPPPVQNHAGRVYELTCQIGGATLQTPSALLAAEDEPMAAWKVFAALLIAKRPTLAYPLFEKLHGKDRDLLHWLVSELIASTNTKQRISSQNNQHDILIEKSLLELIKNYKTSLKMDTFLFNIIMSFFMHRFNYHQVNLLGKLMTKSSIGYDKYTCSLLLRSAFMQKDLVRVNHIMTYIKTNKIGIDRVAYNTVINGFVRNKLFVPALKMFREMITIYKPKLMEYNLLLKILTLRPDSTSTNEILNVWKQMKEFGHSIASYSTIIDYFSKAGDVKAVEKIFKCVAMQNISDSVVDFHFDSKVYDVLREYLDENKGNVVVVEQMKNPASSSTDSIHPFLLPQSQLKTINMYFWNILMKTYLRNNKPLKALQIYSSICIYAKPDNVSLNLLLEYYCMTNNKVEFSNTLAKLQDDGYKVHDYTLSYVIRLHTKNKDIDSVKKIANMFLNMANKEPHLCPDTRIALRITLEAFIKLKYYILASRYFVHYTKTLKPCPKTSLLFIEALLHLKHKPALIKFINTSIEDYETHSSSWQVYEYTSEYYNTAILVVLNLLEEPALFKLMVEKIMVKGFVPSEEILVQYKKLCHSESFIH